MTGGVRFVTHDGGVWIFREDEPDIDVFGPIVVGNNVFIGYGAVILPNVRIGNNCVIAAGSVVSRNVPDGVVAGGIPAQPCPRMRRIGVGGCPRTRRSGSQ